MSENLPTTAVVQRYLFELQQVGDRQPAEDLIRSLLDASVRRLRRLSSVMLLRDYPRLTRPPLNLEADEMLGALVERLIRALRDVRPANVRRFFALAHRHMRWELNDLARQLDTRPRDLGLPESAAAEPESSGSRPSATVLRVLSAIEQLPEDEREAFDLVRIQGLTHNEAAAVCGVSQKTIQRRLNRGLMALADILGDLDPDGAVHSPEVDAG